MCRHKPGARCYAHALTSHGSAVRRLHAAQTAFKAATKETARTDAKARLVEAVRTAENATFDLDATRTQQQKLDSALARDGLHASDRARLDERKAAGIALREARKAQVKAMPPAPAVLAGSGASRLYDSIGTTREQIAYTDARLATATGTHRERLLVRRGVLETDALGLEVAYRLRAADGLPDLGHLTDDERHAIIGGSVQVRRDAAYLSHLRATAERHTGRLDDQVADRETRLRALLGG